MRVEPEQVLEQQRIASQRGAEEAQMKNPFQSDEQQRDGNHRSAQNHDDARSVMRPDKNRQPEPRQSGCAHGVNGDNKIQPGEDGRETGDKNSQRRGHNRGDRIHAAERSVKGPAGVHSAVDDCVQREQRAKIVDIPAQKIDAREGQIFRANHERDQEISKDRGDRWNEEEKDHDDAVHREKLVVGLRRNQITLRGKQMDADHYREGATEKKEKRDGGEIQQANTFVIGRQQPGTNAVARIQIMLARQSPSGGRDGCRSTHGVFFSGGAVAGAAPGAAGGWVTVPPWAVVNDLMYAIKSSTCSSLTSP